MSTKLLYGVLAVALSALACRADTVYLTDGTEADGTIIEETTTTVVIKRASGVVQSFRRADVDAVVIERKGAAPAAKPAEVVPPPPEPKKAISAPKGEEAKPAVAAGTPEPGAAKTKEGEAKPAEAAAKPGETAATPKEGAAKPGETAAQETKAKTKEGGAAKEPAAGKEGAAESTTGTEGEAKETAEGDGKEEKVLKSPPGPEGLSNFPDYVKRMNSKKEKAFMALLEKMGSPEKEKRTLAKSEVGAMGAAVLPYVVAGCYNDNVDARSLCMSLVGELGGRIAIKQIIELFYAAMPNSGQAEDFQLPFINAIKTTLAAITGQSFITVEPDRIEVQEGLSQYIEWYNKNLERLPPQLGEKQIDPTDPDYADLVKSGRRLSLSKRSWPRPITTSDLIQGNKDPARPNPTVDSMIRPSDKTFEKTIPMVPFEDIGKKGR